MPPCWRDLDRRRRRDGRRRARDPAARRPWIRRLMNVQSRSGSPSVSSITILPADRRHRHAVALHPGDLPAVAAADRLLDRVLADRQLGRGRRRWRRRSRRASSSSRAARARAASSPNSGRTWKRVVAVAPSVILCSVIAPAGTKRLKNVQTGLTPLGGGTSISTAAVAPLERAAGRAVDALERPRAADVRRQVLGHLVGARAELGDRRRPAPRASPRPARSVVAWSRSACSPSPVIVEPERAQAAERDLAEREAGGRPTVTVVGRCT